MLRHAAKRFVFTFDRANPKPWQDDIDGEISDARVTQQGLGLR